MTPPPPDAETRTRDRTMTVQDWKALYLVHRLAEQVVLHGAGALDTFVAAMKETPTHHED